MRALAAIIVLALLPVFAPAQVVPVGATPDEVVRALGAPRSRSAAKGREIWLYPNHQAVFEHGRLTALVALPADGGNIAWQKREASAPIPATKGEASGRERIGSTALGSETKGGVAGAMIVKREDGKLVLRSPERTSPPPVKRSEETSFLLIFVSLLAAGAGGAWAALWFRQRRAVASGEKATTDAPSRSGEPAAAPPADPIVDLRPQFAPELKAPTLVDWELTVELLQIMEWKRFELLVQRYFTATGLRAKTHLVGADGGFDLYLYRGRSTRPLSYVQCRSSRQRTVEGRHVRELFALMSDNRVPEGMIVTTGTFTSEAEVFARQNRIALVARGELIARFNRLPQIVRARILADVTAGDFTTPSCPRCNVKLVVREKGGDGNQVWGCRRFPHCRYTMKLRVETSVAPTPV